MSEESMMHRRGFLKRMSLVAGSVGMAGLSSSVFSMEPLYKISLAEWSLHRTLFDGKLDHLEFATTARRKFGIEAVEYVNQFFMEKAEDRAYLREMKMRAESEGVKSLLIMIDDEGLLGSPDNVKRTQAVESHYKWIEAANFLGCHSVRVNALSDPSLGQQEQQKLVADGLRRLSEYGEEYDINVLVENHGGLSSNGEWVVGLIEKVDHPRCGTMPDTGNFQIREGEEYNPYKGVREMMPYAKAVSAEAVDFDKEGRSTQIDYLKMMQIVASAGYRGHIGIEYEGNQLSEAKGIMAAKHLLEQVRDQLAG